MGALGAFRWLPEILNIVLVAPWSPKIASRGALDSPQQRSRRPHREAEGPAKPPMPLNKRLSAYPLTILIAKSKKMQACDIAKAFPRRLWGCRLQCFSFVYYRDVLLLFLLLLIILLLFCPHRLVHYHYETKAKT